MMEKLTKINIQPQAGILGVFSRLNYKPWYAIAEFVDNSTQSFYNHENELKEDGITSISVEIRYDSVSNVLTIVDDAYGMEMEDFTRAVRVDSPPQCRDGRNEFGMGLKTAASWFGNIWSVQSTQYGSKNKYYTEVDILKLREKKINSVDVKVSECAPNQHGTIITIRDVTKKIDSPRTKNKIARLLESMYRRDLNLWRVRISFNGESLNFDPYQCLSFRGKTWKKDLDFSFEFDGHEHRVKGFVGILANGGFGKAGFALFRRGRVVVGGEEQNYKPEDIFGQAQSPISHKLFGEIDLNDFPVNQAKDGFVWDDGLEEAFIQNLKANIKDYINIAKLTNKERAKEEEFSSDASDKVREKVQSFTDAISGLSTNEDAPLFPNEGSLVPGESDIDTLEFKEYLATTNSGEEKIVGSERTYSIMINPVVKKDFKVEWAISGSKSWICVEESEDFTEVHIIININHPFFKPYSNSEDFKIVLEKFVISFVVAEQQAKLTSDNDGYIKASVIRNKMNEFLSVVSEENK